MARNLERVVRQERWSWEGVEKHESWKEEGRNPDDRRMYGGMGA